MKFHLDSAHKRDVARSAKCPGHFSDSEAHASDRISERMSRSQMSGTTGGGFHQTENVCIMEIRTISRRPSCTEHESTRADTPDKNVFG